MYLPGGHILFLSSTLHGLLYGKHPHFFFFFFLSSPCFLSHRLLCVYKESKNKCWYMEQVFLLGLGSHTLLWDIRTDCKSQKHNSAKIVSPCICHDVLISFTLVIENLLCIEKWFLVFDSLFCLYEEGNALDYYLSVFHNFTYHGCLFLQLNQ